MKRNWFWGIICILGAILIFGNLFGFLPFTFSLWKIIGTLICLSVIIDGIKERSFYSPLFGIVIIFYLFRKDLGFEDISFWLLMVGTWLLAWGLTSIFHPEKNHIKVNKQIEINFGDDDTENVEYSTNSIINITSSFGGKVQYIQTNDLQYVTIDSKFSGLKLYFDQATIQNQATIEIDGNFTGIELYVPKEWNVQSHIRAFFGGVDEKGQPSSSGYPTLNITGRIHFGGVEIHYI
ncbi:hypothetical protein [uncultured Holdemanella sp.]|uniref:LiaF transmembrane domain-containing protein n=1 Tax=uncultured Holdemanella sp. TaxID=1763549 RepID=UPI00265A586B|nr:hypothetical protein [uncultured Holdemanella sp.]